MDLFARYVFVDCLLIDFRIDSRLQSLDILAEAYIRREPIQADGAVYPGKIQLHVRIRNPVALAITLIPGFSTDLQRAYDVQGNDMRANEVIGMSAVPSDDPQHPDATVVTIHTDFLTLSARSRDVHVDERPRVSRDAEEG